MSPKNTNNKKKYTLCASHAVDLFCLQFSLKKKNHKDRFSSFWFSATTVGTKWLSVMKSPATMLTVPSLEPGLCSFTQLISVGLVDITRSFRDSDGCVQMYFRSTVRLIPVTKNPSADDIKKNRRLKISNSPNSSGRDKAFVCSTVEYLACRAFSGAQRPQ